MQPALEPDTAADDGRYAVLLRTRCRVAGKLYPAGTKLLITANRLRVAANFVKTGAARPADARTRLDVELYLALDAALPPR